MSSSCVFCRIVSGEIPAVLLAENEHAIAFRDLDPKAPVHVLVIPRRHVGSLADVNDGAELGALLLLAGEVARVEGVAESGYRTVLNTGSDGGHSAGRRAERRRNRRMATRRPRKRVISSDLGANAAVGSLTVARLMGRIQGWPYFHPGRTAFR
jgi:histidine triad (HIT) family protein